jgi:hypothetical protein
MRETERRLAQLATKPKRVEVEWIDSGRNDGWTGAVRTINNLDVSPVGESCYAAGYLIDDRPESVTIALSYTTDPETGLHHQYLCPLTIPRVAVVELHELRR